MLYVLYDSLGEREISVCRGAELCNPRSYCPAAAVCTDTQHCWRNFCQAPLIIGTPDEAIQEIERYRQETRVTHLVMWMQMAGLAPQRVRRSMELFAKEVMPHFWQ